jgi:ornithine cyclodeaminase/alanine dehydrogenase-like protein (mu-crystallin family)
MRLINAAEVRANLTYELAIPTVRAAMIAFSKGETLQLLRSILPMAEGRMFGVMPGALGGRDAFGAKILSVFPGNFDKGLASHQGVILLFEPENGVLACIAEAGEVTAIRTAAASAVATDALARADAGSLAILGYGEQALTHARAISRVRSLRSLTVWGRSGERAEAFAAKMEAELGVPARACASAREAVAGADIICTVTPAKAPILEGAWVAPGAHVNVVGSSYAGPVEVDNDLVVRSRFIADSREGVLAQGAEFLRAKAAGLVGDEHVAAEIGEVLAGTVPGRRTDEEITVYKSLGHIVQDLASVRALMDIPPT